ncbi:helix-turn-helix domain-containing protein [Nocardiopsis sediminis]|uniref:Helix-turn-helix domain-containing protein n=1 Tax=Nocardiopsis sediminis TaxID=1778267 RepID=A0ABV8FNA7_9ACTN
MIETELSTEHLPPSDRFAYWNEIYPQALVPCVLQSDATDDFRVRALHLDLGSVQVSKIAMPLSRVVRPARLVRQRDPETYFLLCNLRGGHQFTQAGRESFWGRRELLFYDSSRPYHGTMLPEGDDERSTLIITQFPRDLLPLPPDELDSLVSTNLPGTGIEPLLIHCLSELSYGSRRHTPADAARLSSVALDLITALFAHILEADAAVLPETHHRVLATRIRAFIEARLPDPGLTPAAIAAAHHISLGHLHRVFDAGRGQGVAAWIRQRRLQRCRRDLSDPALAVHPIQAIASRWGFTDSPHFSRVFRAAYGMSPREYRHQWE